MKTILYKTNFKKTTQEELKRKIFESLSKYETPVVMENGSKFIIYHNCKVIKKDNAYFVKTYFSNDNVEEVTNLFLLHLLLESIDKEITIVIEEPNVA